MFTRISQVAIEHLDRDENKTEVVHAKFVIGSDGASRMSAIPSLINVRTL